MTGLKRILIADDGRSMRTTLAELLTSRGYTVVEADDAESAVKMAASSVMSAFMVDLQISGKSGIDLCRSIRSMDRYKVAPIILMTNNDDPATLVDAFAAGCDDFISKPLEPTVLLARLTAHLQRTEYLKELEETRLMLHRYMSTRTREIAETCTKTGSFPSPEQREVVILFTDIRGFTALAEQMKPSELFELLSAQLEQQVTLVYEHGGYIDKFGGDGVMAVFDRADKARQACLCACSMIRKAREDRDAGNKHIRQLGIGIHMGPAVIGHIGSSTHMDYSVIGTTVNLAARLCGHAEPMSIVVSDVVRNAADLRPDLRFESRRQVAIRGLKAPVTVYNLKSS
jgi:adenylate cyclase